MRKEYMNLNATHAELIKDVVGRIRRYIGEPTTDEALLEVLEPLTEELENMRRELQFPIKESLVDKVRQIRDIQAQDGNWDYNQYMCGMFNGLELAMAILENREPEYKKPPEPAMGAIEYKEPIIQVERFNFLDEFNLWAREHKNIIGIHFDSKDRVIAIYHDYGGDDE